MDTKPLQTEGSPINPLDNTPTYVGFWARVGAALIDTVCILLVINPLLMLIYGNNQKANNPFSDPVYLQKLLNSLLDPNRRGPVAIDISSLLGDPVQNLVSFLLTATAIIIFWRFRSATPGKIVIGAVIVDEKTGNPPSTTQLIGRYFGYFVSMLPLMLGLIWVGFDKRKQGFHDKLAGTVVIKQK